MTIHGPGTPITMQQVNAEFGLGTDLNDYRGVRWYLDNAATGTFDDNSIDMAEFYSKRATSPVTPGSQTFTSSGTFVAPVYSILTVDIRGGSGGGAGGGGNTTPGSPGTAGGTSYFGSYGSGDYGRGGFPNNINGTNGAGSIGYPAGGAGGAGTGGGAGGGYGGASGRTVIQLTNPTFSGTGPVVGSSISVTIGAGGLGGAAGAWVVQTPYGPIGGSAGVGANGAAGVVTVTWS